MPRCKNAIILILRINMARLALFQLDPVSYNHLFQMLRRQMAILTYHGGFEPSRGDILNPSNMVFSNFHVLTSPNVDMCSMGKVATTQWRKVFCDLDWDGNGCQYLRGKHGKVLGMKSGGMVPRMSGNEKPMFVFLRDPLERFPFGLSRTSACRTADSSNITANPPKSFRIFRFSSSPAADRRFSKETNGNCSKHTWTLCP